MSPNMYKNAQLNRLYFSRKIGFRNTNYYEQWKQSNEKVCTDNK